MAWIEFHPSRIIKLKKFIDLRIALKIRPNECLGLLGRLWGETIEVRENGDISDWTPEYLCELTGIGLDPELVWNALLDNRWIDKTGAGRILIHDWLSYAGRYLQAKYRTSNPEVLKEIWGVYGKTLSKAPLSPSLDSPPNPTIPNHTLPSPTKPKKNNKVGAVKKSKDPMWPHLIKIVGDLYLEKRKKKIAWESEGKFFKDLRSFSNTYQHSGTLALWELYLTTSNHYGSDKGYAPRFFSMVHYKLLDDPLYRVKKQRYERELALKEKPNENLGKIRALTNGMLKTAKSIPMEPRHA